MSLNLFYRCWRAGRGLERSVGSLVAMALVLVCLSPAAALNTSDDLGSLHYTVYAPDWIWQKNAVNILVVLENDGAVDVEADLALVFPDEHADHFEYTLGDAENRVVTIPAGETVRHAFTNILAKGDVALGTFAFRVDIASGGAAQQVDYALKTIRGPVVNSATWAALLPAILCAGCCLVFIFFLRNHGERGAWKTPSEPISAPENPEPWINQKP